MHRMQITNADDPKPDGPKPSDPKPSDTNGAG